MNVPGRASPSGPAPLVPGDTVDRYIVEGPLGAGTMGQVFAARDPELDRPIAIKLVHYAGSAEEERLLLEEARVLARLTHPNVVRVYDAGIATTRGGRKAFLAMERASGRTLWDWLRAGPYPWRDVARRLADAARGLAAAHDAGLVHGDFKPSNVLLAVDGRPLVADFGLARPHGEGMTGELTGDGTPAFAAPELKRGARPSPGTDQFSFGVTLYEALYNVLPFPGDDLAKIAQMAASGPPGPPPRARRLPRRLRAVVTRCLQPDPRARFASLAQVATALDAATSPVRASVLIAAAATAALALVALWPNAVPTPPPACTALAARAKTTFDARARQAARAAFEATKTPYAAVSWARVERTLAGLVSETSRSGARMCSEAGTSAEAEALATLRVECLDRVLTGVDTVSQAFAHADARMVQAAVGSSYALARPVSCDHPGAAESQALVTRLRVRQLRDALTRVRAASRVGASPSDRPKLEWIAAEARRAGARSVEAECLIALAGIDSDASKPLDALAHTEAALLAAEASGDDRLAAHIAMGIADNLSELKDRFTEADQWVKLTAARIERIGGDALLEADLANVRAGIAYRRGDFAAALVAIEETQRRRAGVVPAGHPHLAETLGMRATILFGLGRYEEGRSAHREALAELEASLGPSHPSLLPILNNLANAEDRLANYAGAAAIHRRSLALREALFGPRSRSVVNARLNLGLSLAHADDPVGARAELMGAIALLEALGDPTDPGFAIALTNLADLDAAEGNLAQAEGRLVRAIELSTPKDGPPHPRMAILESSLAKARCGLGRCLEALAGLDRAALAQAPLPADHQERIGPLAARVDVLLALGRGREAAAIAADVIVRLERVSAGPKFTGGMRFLRARGLGMAGKRAQARAEAARARAELVTAGESTRELDAWRPGR